MRRKKNPPTPTPSTKHTESAKVDTDKVARFLGEFMGGMLRSILFGPVIRAPETLRAPAPDLLELLLSKYRDSSPALERQGQIHRDLYDASGRETPAHATLCAVSIEHAEHARAVRIHRGGFSVGYERAYAQETKRDPSTN